MSKYILSKKALEDINTIWIYTAENWSQEQADRYYNLLNGYISIRSFYLKISIYDNVISIFHFFI